MKIFTSFSEVDYREISTCTRTIRVVAPASFLVPLKRRVLNVCFSSPECDQSVEKIFFVNPGAIL